MKKKNKGETRKLVEINIPDDTQIIKLNIPENKKFKGFVREPLTQERLDEYWIFLQYKKNGNRKSKEVVLNKSEKPAK